MNFEEDSILPAIREPAQEPTPLALIARMVEAGSLTSESVSVIKELVALKEHMEDRQAEKDFALAFAELQSELRTFQATKPVPDKLGNIKFMSLPYDELMDQLRPHLSRYQFSISFSADEFRDGRFTTVCTLQHASGFSRQSRSFVRVGSGPPGSTESQADGAAMSYGKGYALSLMLNLAIDRHTDARAEGNPINADQVDTLRKLVAATGADEKGFLRFAGAETYEEIGSKRFKELVSALEKKARAKA